MNINNTNEFTNNHVVDSININMNNQFLGMIRGATFFSTKEGSSVPQAQRVLYIVIDVVIDIIYIHIYNIHI